MPKRLFPNRRNGIFFFQLRFFNCAFKKTFQITFHRGITLFHSFLLACLLIITLSETEHFEIESIPVNEALSLTIESSHVKECGKFLFVKCKIPAKVFACGIQNTAQEIQNPVKDWNPESMFHWKGVESGIHDVQSRIQDCLGFAYTGRNRGLSSANSRGVVSGTKPILDKTNLYWSSTVGVENLNH